MKKKNQINNQTKHTNNNNQNTKFFVTHGVFFWWEKWEPNLASFGACEVGGAPKGKKERERKS
jgi:hypothetical protein